MFPFAAFGATLLLAGCQTLGETGSVRTYGNIEVNEESIDAGGMEVEIRKDGSRTAVFLVLCEGGCYGATASDVVVDGETISLRWRHPLPDPDPTGERYVFRRIANGLVVQAPENERGWVLKRTRSGKTREWARYH
jgi:hypothetical protein